MLTANPYGIVGSLESESIVTICGSSEATEEIVIVSLAIAPYSCVELRTAVDCSEPKYLLLMSAPHKKTSVFVDEESKKLRRQAGDALKFLPAAAGFFTYGSVRLRPSQVNLHAPVLHCSLCRLKVCQLGNGALNGGFGWFLLPGKHFFVD